MNDQPRPANLTALLMGGRFLIVTTGTRGWSVGSDFSGGFRN